ncbi:MAG: CSLREA domain-containing protein, partial [Anaerolineales bacterium]|nr:CSLREA domain-containing protein [Anaerolineales bacterium]
MRHLLFPHLSSRPLFFQKTSYLFILFILTVLVFGTQQTVYAAAITVNSAADVIADDGQCTLREAIIAANTDTASGVSVGECAAGDAVDTITVPANTYNLTLVGADDTAAAGDLDITADITITGAGASTTIIDAAAISDRAIHVLSGTVILNGLTIQEGNVAGGTNCSLGGGGIQNLATLTLNDMVIQNNSAGNTVCGAGVDNDGGVLTVNRSLIDSNASANCGGGFTNRNGGDLTVRNSTISQNTSNSCGGSAIFNTSTATTLVEYSTIVDNTQQGTISGRTGLHREDGSITVNSSIVARNANNGVTSNFSSPNTSIHSTGYNLTDEAGIRFASQPTDQVVATAALGVAIALSNNGGTSHTYALLPNSPAIDGGDVGTVPATDQRGISRPLADGPDIGSLEMLPIVRNFTVNSTADGADAIVGDNVCETATPGQCTLRAAIQEANTVYGSDTIDFNIVGAGVQTINTGGLPAIIDGVTIDGYSQPGTSANTLAVGSDAVLLIELSGAGSGNGLTISGSDVTVRGLVINGYNRGVWLNGATNATVAGNFIGTNAAGTVADANNSGVYINNFSTNSTIGGSAPADRNVISGNGEGVDIWGSGDNINQVLNPGVTGIAVQGNYIGVASNGTAALGNTGNGIIVRNYASQNSFGGANAGEGNTIANNGQYAVNMLSGYQTEIVGNSIYNNTAGAFNLSLVGVNDAGDGDTSIGAQRVNMGQNYPTLANALVNGLGDLTIDYTIDSIDGNSSYPIAIDFY